MGLSEGSLRSLCSVLVASEPEHIYKKKKKKKKKKKEKIKTNTIIIALLQHFNRNNLTPKHDNTANVVHNVSVISTRELLIQSFSNLLTSLQKKFSLNLRLPNKLYILGRNWGSCSNSFLKVNGLDFQAKKPYHFLLCFPSQWKSSFTDLTLRVILEVTKFFSFKKIVQKHASVSIQLNLIQ